VNVRACDGATDRARSGIVGASRAVTMWLLNAAGERVPFSVSKFLGRVCRRMDDDNVTGLAAQVSFYFALALFPFLILLGAIVGTLPFTHSWQAILAWITESLPSDTREVVFATLANLTRGRKSFFSLGLLGTIWPASGGLMSLASALNAIYHVTETRSYLRRSAICVLTLFVLAILVLVSFGLLSAGDWIDRWLALYGARDSPLLIFPLVRWVISALLIALGIDVTDYLLPNLKRPWRWIRLRIGFMVTAWLMASLGFNWYLQHVASYNQTYGVLGAFFVLMIWIYIAVLIALAGGEIDAELHDFRNASAQQTIPSQGHSVIR
jgi:membrane protein